MTPFLTAEKLVGGACLTVALIHLAIGLRGYRTRLHVLFSLTAIAAGIDALAAAWLYHAPTFRAFSAASRLDLVFQSCFGLALIWFVMLYAGIQRNLPALLITGLCVAVVLVNAFSPYSFLYGQIPALGEATLPWGERLVVATTQPGPWHFISDIFGLGVIVYCLGGVLILRRRGKRDQSKALAWGLAPLVVIAIPHGILIDRSILQSPYLLNFAFLGFVLVVSMQLVSDVVRSSKLSGEVYRIVADNTYDWEYWIGPDHKYRYVSLSCERLAGYSPTDFMADPDLRHRLIHPHDLQIFRAHLTTVEEDRESGALEYRIVRKDGTIRWIHHVCQPVFADDGQYLGVRGSNRDVTDRKELEESRLRWMRELEALEAQIEAENVYLKKEFLEAHEFKEIVGRSNAILYVLGRVKEVAGTDSAVLIQGETGVGKELVARAIHNSGSRAKKPFIRVNCASLPATLVESELFGHDLGAFTGAVKQRKGRFEIANGGTLFLDEIAEMPMEMQAKLLHVLQDGEFQRVGGIRTLKSDVRIIAATNRNLQEEVDAGRFRADLYYRLNVFPITIPPLRQRREDIPLLVDHFVTQMAKQMGKTATQISNPVMAELESYGWPGNVRELRNVLERALITSTGPVLRLFERLQERLPLPSEPDTVTGGFSSLEGVERKHILGVLKSTNWRISGPKGAAKILGLNPSTLHSRLKKLDIRKKS